MRLDGIAIGVVAGLLSFPVLAQTALEERETDIIATVTQIGEVVNFGDMATGANAAVVRQTGNAALQGSNALEINQLESGNRAFVLQQSLGSGLFSAPADNLLSITQNGFDNTAIGTQVGADNDGSIVQTGDGNEAEIVQFGGSLDSTIIQEGNGLSARSVQIGNALAPVMIYQTGPGAPAVSITRTAP